MLTTIIFPLLLQVGPNPALAPAPAVPDELVEQRRRKKEEQRPPIAVVEADPVQACAALAAAAPDSALEEAQARFDSATGLDRAIAAHCLGIAYTEMEQWPEAAEALGQARAALPAPSRSLMRPAPPTQRVSKTIASPILTTGNSGIAGQRR